MLVLSRKSGEAIVFPALDITVAVSSIKGKCVALSVEAPSDIRILRQELVPRLEHSCKQQLGVRGLPHELRNQLNTIGLSLNMLLRQLEKGDSQDTATLTSVIDQLHNLDEALQSGGQAPVELESEKRLALVVDDNENESALLAAFLRNEGYRVGWPSRCQLS
ncbi:MAG: hypothetical protein Aurels2KO_22900 [Aureliella sp.]